MPNGQVVGAGGLVLGDSGQGLAVRAEAPLAHPWVPVTRPGMARGSPSTRASASSRAVAAAREFEDRWPAVSAAASSAWSGETRPHHDEGNTAANSVGTGESRAVRPWRWGAGGHGCTRSVRTTAAREGERERNGG
jgi:hypothetical protein